MSTFWRDTIDVKFKDGNISWRFHYGELVFWRDRDVKFKDGDISWRVHYGELIGSLDGQSTVSGILYKLSKGIYEQIANNISTCFDILAEINNIIIRYDNDPSEISTDEIWCESRIDFGKAIEINLGINYSRIPGIFNIIIHSPIGQGIADVLNIADVVATRFRTVVVDDIINFQVPRIENVGRIENNYQVNVICPFQVDN